MYMRLSKPEDEAMDNNNQDFGPYLKAITESVMRIETAANTGTILTDHSEGIQWGHLDLGMLHYLTDLKESHSTEA